MDERLIILKRLEIAEAAGTHEVRQWLRSREADPLFDRAIFVTAYEAHRLWRLRLINSRSAGCDLPALDSLVQSLSRLQANVKLRQFSFTDQHQICSIYFEKISGKYVGALLSSEKQVELAQAS